MNDMWFTTDYTPTLEEEKINFLMMDLHRCIEEENYEKSSRN